ncbi:DUF2075 domain-containing protein [Sneathia sp. DSM 16630]|nr:DUF2075 domain-containing protein [Sneathia sp. DSM 16630]
MARKYCYADSIENFLGIEKAAWEEKMKSAFEEVIDLPLGKSQIGAWADCYDVLQKELVGDLSGFSIVFEYVLPYENGRRPDVLLVSNEAVIILEFKRKSVVHVEDLDQAADYGRDIREYHFESRDKTVVPMLVLTWADNISYIDKDVRICSSDKLMENLNAVISSIGSITFCDIDKWIDSKYEPLPTVVEAARRFWNSEELPNIKQVHAGTNLDEAIACLKSVTEEAESNRKNVLALVTGVPGAGKTFLGLQFVYDVCKKNDNQNSIFLSGNGPLIEVLNDALTEDNFVMKVNNVISQFIDYKNDEFNKNIIVFDEGQRAWDEPRMTKRYNTKSSGRTEPDVLIQLCDEKLEWCLFLVLIGEGQEINDGENGGIVQWYNAIARSDKSWSVVCPDKLAEVFEGADVKTYDVLDLKVSIRSHTAGEVSNFVNKFIAGELDEAAALVEKIPQQDFHMYYTRDLYLAKRYCRGKYEHQPEKRYGMIVSSKVSNLSGVKTPKMDWKDNQKKYPDGSGRRWKVADWFNKESNHPDSCCALTVAVTEFDCQGLEIDMPIIVWGEDAKWIDGHWDSTGTDDEVTYRNNRYRVLLTRGREGFIVYIPEGQDEIAAIFERVGIKELKK